MNWVLRTAYFDISVTDNNIHNFWTATALSFEHTLNLFSEKLKAIDVNLDGIKLKIQYFVLMDSDYLQILLKVGSYVIK